MPTAGGESPPPSPRWVTRSSHPICAATVDLALAMSTRWRPTPRDLVELGSGWDLVLGHSLGGAAVALAAVSDPSFAKRIILEDPALVIPDTASALEWLLEPFAGEMTAESVAAAAPGWHPEDARIKAEALRQSGAEPSAERSPTTRSGTS